MADTMTPPPPMASGDMGEGYERLGGNKLSLIDVLAQSVGFMGPVFSAAFIIPLIIGVNAAARGAGTSAPLSVLLAAVGVFALGWIVAQYAKRIHAAGSLYDYVSNGLGRTIGAAAGWLYYAGTIILTVGLGVLLGGYVHDNLWPTLFNGESPLPIWLWDAILAIGLFAVLYFGVQISTRVQLTLALISVAVVLIFFVTVIADASNDLGTAFDPTPSPGGFSGILFGVLYGVLIFVGFETAANLAEETAEPKRSIPKAVLGAVVIVSLFYLIASYAEVAGFGFDLSVITSFEVSQAPLFALGAPGSPVGSEFWLKLLLVVVFLDMLAVYVGAAVASTRGTFAMARDRRLPGALATVARKYGTPIGAIVLLIAIQVILILVAETNDTLLQIVLPPELPQFPHYFSIFVWCSTFGGFALLVVYLLMSIGALRGLAGGEGFGGVVIAAILGIAITAAGIFGSFYKVTSPTLIAPWSALIWFVIGLVYMSVVRGRAPAAEALGDLHTDATVAR
ncbi:MAG TPA: APC family permease [Actinomycetota bacterium]|nr:APC family permease [Actinomycetota bacterium]